MYGFKKLGFILALSCAACQAVASLDPIGQTLSPQQLPSFVKIGDSLSATYTLTNNKKNPVKVTITSTSVGEGIITHDQCNGRTLAKQGAPGSQCTINISIDPTTAGPLRWTGIMHYDFNDVPLRALSTTTIQQTQSVEAQTPVDLPAETTLDHAPYPFTFQFTNKGTTPVTGTGGVTANVSTFQIENNGCINKTLTHYDDFCLIVGTFSPDAVGHVSIQGAYTYNAGKSTASAITETTVQAPSGQVVAKTDIPLQNPTYVNKGPYRFSFKFTNNGAAPVTGNGVFNAHGAPVSVANHCLNKTLRHDESCYMTGTFSPVKTGDVTLNGDFIYDAGTLTASTSTDTSVRATSGIVAQVITPLPPNASINTNYPVEFRFTNTSGAAVAVTEALTLPNVTGIVNTCPNPGLFAATPPHNVCTISGTFNSSGSSSVQTLTAEMRSSLPPAIATTQTLTNPTDSFFVSFWPVSLRVSAGALNMPYQFQYTLVNNQTTPTLVTVNFIAPASATLVAQAPTSPPTKPDNLYFKSYYNCAPGGVNTPFDPNQNLALTIPPQAAGGVCNIFTTFTVTTTSPPNPYTDNFIMAFTGPSAGFPSVVTPLSYATGQQIEANGQPLSRTIHFTNHCPYTVYYALHGASIQAKNKSSVACTTNADCFTGSTCISNECQWAQPVPTDGYALTPGNITPTSTSIQIPLYDNAIKLNLDSTRDIAWGGNLAGRVGCTAGTGCTVNDCGLAAGDSIGACSTGIGSARAPISASEFTLQSDDPLIYSNNIPPNEAADNYNVQTIDGVTVPSTMTPIGAPYEPSAPYKCGGAGLKTVQPGSQLASCSWTYSPPLSDYNWVQYNTQQSPCTNDGDCSTLPGTHCGLMVNPTGTAVFTRACGLPAFSAQQPMYWTADAICKTVPNYNAYPFFCSHEVSTIPGNVNSPTTTTISTMYACNAGELKESCYTTGAPDTCCGCENWSSAPTGTQTCNSTNPGWTSQVLPLIEWTKSGCPTSYAYPYDDASSSFTCMMNEVLTVPEDSYDGNINTTNYEIEFCPQ